MTGLLYRLRVSVRGVAGDVRAVTLVVLVEVAAGTGV
jgi:hypothetical protein